jgi:hypothetical protein
MVNVREEIERMESEGSTHSRGMMDIRFFIGLLFIIYGLILAVYGLVSTASPGIEVIPCDLNKVWGGVLFVFGLAFFIPSKKPSQWNK